MKNRSWLIFVLVSLFFLVSCGGDENGSAQEDSGDADGENASVSIRAVKDAGCTGMQIDCLSQQLAAISFQIRNGQGETIFQKSVERKEQTSGVQGDKKCRKRDSCSGCFRSRKRRIA